MISRNLLKYLGLFILTYAVLFLVFKQPGVQRRCAEILGSSALSLFSWQYPDIRFATAVAPNKENKTTLRVGYGDRAAIQRALQQNRKSGSRKASVGMRNAEFLIEYYTMPFIFMLALIAITPLNWPQRLMALAGGILLFYLYSLLKMNIAMNLHLVQSDLREVSESWQGILEKIVEIMQIGFSFAIGVLIWFLLAFRKSNWKDILNRLNTAFSQS